MLDNIRYVNHKGREIVFGADGLFANESDIRDYSYDLERTGSRITSIIRSFGRKTVPVRMCLENDGANVVKDRVVEVFEADIDAEIPGKLYANDWYIDCFITEIRNEKYLLRDGYLRMGVGIDFASDYWVRETTYQLESDASIKDYGYLDFPIGFDFDLSPNPTGKTISNPAPTASPFVMRIYGAVEDPSIIIGGTTYSCVCNVPDGGYLYIDSREGKKACVVVGPGGEQTNVFSKRSKGKPGSGAYMFEPIASGISDVVLPMGSRIYVTLFERRSTPSWN